MKATRFREDKVNISLSEPQLNKMNLFFTKPKDISRGHKSQKCTKVASQQPARFQWVTTKQTRGQLGKTTST